MDEWAADNVRAAAAAAAAAVAARVHRWQEAALQHARRAGQWQGCARKAGWRHPCQPTLNPLQAATPCLAAAQQAT